KEANGETLRKALDYCHQEPGGEGAVERGEAWEQLKQRISYLSGDFTKDAIYDQIKDRLATAPTGNAAFYLAVQPRFFGAIVDKLAAHKLTEETDKAFRLIEIEKPFGTDHASAQWQTKRIPAR